MPDNPPPFFAGHAVVDWADLQRMATTAAHDAVAQLKDRAISRDDAEEIATQVADKTVDRLLEKFGIEKDDMNEFRRDLDFIRKLHINMDTAVRHGILATIGLIVLGVGSAIVFALKGGRV